MRQVECCLRKALPILRTTGRQARDKVRRILGPPLPCNGRRFFLTGCIQCRTRHHEHVRPDLDGFVAVRDLVFHRDDQCLLEHFGEPHGGAVLVDVSKYGPLKREI